MSCLRIQLSHGADTDADNMRLSVHKISHQIPSALCQLYIDVDMGCRSRYHYHILVYDSIYLEQPGGLFLLPGAIKFSFPSMKQNLQIMFALTK